MNAVRRPIEFLKIKKCGTYLVSLSTRRLFLVGDEIREEFIPHGATFWMWGRTWKANEVDILIYEKQEG